MGRLSIDLTGQRFGKLVVLKKVPNKINSKDSYWLCKCDCGNEKIINNQYNRRNNLYITYKNKTHTLSEWSELLGINYNCLFIRYYRGWSVDELFLPVGSRRYKK